MSFDLVDSCLFPPERYPLLPLTPPGFADQFDRVPAKSIRKIERGRITFYNYQEAVLPQVIVEDTPTTTSVLRDAFFTRFEEDKPETSATQANPRHWSGAIYASDGDLLSEFMTLGERFNGPHSNQYNFYVNAPKAEGSRIRTAERLHGRHIYLGFLRNHFGHFLLESLARSWALVDLDKSTRVVFHASNPRQVSLPPFARQLLASLGIDQKRIVIAHSDYVIEELIVPSIQFWLDWKGSPGMCIAFERMRERLSATVRSTCSFPKRIYLSRRFMEAPLQNRANTFAGNSVRHQYINAKIVANEEQVEALFAARGFEIVAPEVRPVEEQVMLVANASEIAGLGGSALHLALFNGNPNARLIALDLRPSVNQVTVDTIRGIRAFHVDCVASHDDLGRPRLDCELIWQVLKEIEADNPL